MSQTYKSRAKRAASELQVLDLRNRNGASAADPEQPGLVDEVRLKRETEARQAVVKAREHAANEVDALSPVDTSPVKWRLGEHSYNGMFADAERIYTDLNAHVPELVARQMRRLWSVPSYLFFRLSDERVRAFGKRVCGGLSFCFVAASILPLPVLEGWALGSTVLFSGLALMQHSVACYFFDREPRSPTLAVHGGESNERKEMFAEFMFGFSSLFVASGYYFIASRPDGWHEVAAGMAVWVFWSFVVAIVFALGAEVVEYRSIPRGEGAMRALWRKEVSKDAARNRWRHELLELAERHDGALQALKAQVKLSKAMDRPLPTHFVEELAALKKLRRRVERAVTVGALLQEHGDVLSAAKLDNALVLRTERGELARIEAMAEYLLDGRLVSSAPDTDFDARLEEAERHAGLR